MSDCRHLIVPFGLEGVIYYKNIDEVDSYLYFLQYEFEGNFVQDNLGTMYGLNNITFPDTTFIQNCNDSILMERVQDVKIPIFKDVNSQK